MKAKQERRELINSVRKEVKRDDIEAQLRDSSLLELEQEKWKREQENHSDEFDSDEEDLETVKQRLIQRNRNEAPGRFYVEKNRGSAICEEEARREARAGRDGGQKRGGGQDAVGDTMRRRTGCGGE